MKRTLKDLRKRLGFHLFRWASRLGIHVLPVHYYSSVPNILELERTQELWAKKSALPGLGFDKDEQVRNLREICLPFQKEYFGNEVYKQAVRENYGPGFGFLEAQALRAIVRRFKPGRVLEVGSGVSTFCMLDALRKNESEGGSRFKLTCVEPHPSNRLTALKGIELVNKKVQETPLSSFEALGPGDFLFIDSSHVVKAGSDVNYIVLEVLPRLRQGVLVHFHDVVLPYDYPRDLLQTFIFPNETSLLRAFLINNHRVRILFCMSYLHYEAPEALKDVFPEYEPQPDQNGLTHLFKKPFESLRTHFPSSLYFEITDYSR